MANETMTKFGHPDTLIRDYEHWSVLLRPAQVTLGSLVLVAKGDETAFGQLPAGAHAELARITREIEGSLSAAIEYQKINYLMLMMVDPHVHFHIFPRYEGSKSSFGLEVADVGWPGPPDLKSGVTLDAEQLAHVCNELTQLWLNYN